MITSAEVTRMVHLLTEDVWSPARRNVLARDIARTRGDNDPVGRRVFPIVQQGVVGRYDRHRAELLKILAETNGCTAYVNSESYNYQGKRRKYTVSMFGHESDMDRSIALYKELVTQAIAHMLEMTGEQVGQRRRVYFRDFLSRTSSRLQDVGKAPAVRFLSQHHEDAHYAATEAGAHEFHRERA